MKRFCNVIILLTLLFSTALLLSCLPDLIVTQAGYTPGQPTTMDVISFSAEIENAGSNPAETSELKFYLGNFEDPFRHSVPFLVPALMNNETHIFERDATLALAGDWVFTVVVDEENLLEEVSDQNNQVQRNFKVTDAGRNYGAPLAFHNPDLVISELTYSPENPTTLSSIELTAVVRNIGRERAEPFSVRLDIQNIEFQQYEIDGLDASSSRTIEQSWTPSTGGDHLVTFIADHGNAVFEDSDNNNRRSITIPINTPPDLIVEEMGFQPENPTVGNGMSFRALVRNTGGPVTGSFDVGFRLQSDEDSPIMLESSAELENNAATITMPWTPTSEGSYNVIAIADVNASITESDEENNQSDQLSFEVCTPNPCSGLCGQMPDGCGNVLICGECPPDGPENVGFCSGYYWTYEGLVDNPGTCADTPDNKVKYYRLRVCATGRIAPEGRGLVTYSSGCTFPTLAVELQCRGCDP